MRRRSEGIDSAIERAVAYVEAGADMIFPEAMQSLDDYRRFKAAVKVPILANLTEFGSTPFFTTSELREANVDIALYCCGAYRAMNAAALNFYETTMRDGTQKAAVADDADARRPLQIPWLSRVRRQTRRIVRRNQVTFKLETTPKMSEADSTTPATGTFKPKKSVALSGVTAGNTALCTVGRTGNDLHYRGYDILELARACEFEEIALSAGP